MSGAGELQTSVCLKSFNVQNWEIRFILGLSDAKNTQYIKKKASDKSCLELDFVQKSPRAHKSISPMSGAGGIQSKSNFPFLYSRRV